MNYNKKVMENFMHPKNMGEIKNPDGVGKVGNPVCGDIMWIYIKVSKDKKGNEKISDIKFKTFGCAAAIATSSMITQFAKGKTFKEAQKISMKDIADELGGLPNIKMHCSHLAITGLKKAMLDYKEKNKHLISPSKRGRTKAIEDYEKQVQEKIK
jgi:nitrogen fixation protein NifU and related proteins